MVVDTAVAIKISELSALDMKIDIPFNHLPQKLGKEGQMNYTE